MRFIVLIKQVPFVDQLKFDPEAKRIIREGVPSEINPFDKRALTRAIELKNQIPGSTVVVVTMGPPQAKDALIEALAMGADRAVHLLGREFAGADTLATAGALALACRKIGYDIILAGKYSTDAETAQVPPMVAELLDVPQITGATSLELSPDQSTVVARRELDGGFMTVSAKIPLVVTAAERLVKPLKVAPSDLDKGARKPIEIITAQELAEDISVFGAPGSPTRVSDIFSIEPQRKHIIHNAGVNPEPPVRAVVDDLLDEGLFSVWKSRPPMVIHPRLRTRASSPRDIWVVVESAGKEIRPATFELLGRAVQLANDFDGQVTAILLGHHIHSHAKILIGYGADKVLLADDEALGDYATETYASVLASAIQDRDPFAVLFLSTAQGRDLAPRVAARLRLGLTGDCIGLQIDGEGHLVQLKPAFGGNYVAPILSATRPAVATVRPGVFQPADRDDSRKDDVEDLDVVTLPEPRVRILETENLELSGVELDTAQVVIGIGMGIGGPENIPAVRELADVLGAPVGGTRKVVDAGWLPRQLQIGLTGRSISPRLYVAIGVSGKFNHTVGIQGSGVVLAINQEPSADIFRHADYGIVGDWMQVVPILTRELERARSERHKSS